MIDLLVVSALELAQNDFRYEAKEIRVYNHFQGYIHITNLRTSKLSCYNENFFFTVAPKSITVDYRCISFMHFRGPFTITIMVNAPQHICQFYVPEWHVNKINIKVATHIREIQLEGWIFILPQMTPPLLSIKHSINCKVINTTGLKLVA